MSVRSASTSAGAARGPCTYVSATSDTGRREARADRREHVALRRRVVARHEPDAPRQTRERPLALLREQPFAGELRLQPFDRREVLADAEALDRQRAQSKVAARLVELRPAENVDALAVTEIEAQRVEAAARDRDREGRRRSRVLEREEDATPSASWRRSSVTSPSTQTRRQPREPVGDALLKEATV